MKRSFLILLLNLLGLGAFAQVEVTFPVNRLVFQRDNNNRGVVFIGGTFNDFCDRIEARLLPVQGGTSVGWTTISSNPQGGVFNGALAADGGWYRLEVRTIRSGSAISSSSVEKVGVGEVFLISGQSNAQGYFGFGQQGAQDDRVNTVSNFYSFGNITPVYPEFSKLDADTRIAPKGDGAWCWGQLGDKLVQRLNVPVLFLNAAWEGLSVGDFTVSADGGSGRNVFSGYVAPAGYPYNSVREIIQYYINMLGVRSVLWHQGETDNWVGTPTSVYVDRLRYLISRTRQDTGKNIAWVVSRVSLIENRTSQTIIDGQNIVINTGSNVFPGPETDYILERVDGTHFSATGLGLLATAWNNSLTNSFFQNSQPVMARDPLTLSSACISSGNQPLRLTAVSSMNSYVWNTGATGNSLQIGNGTYQATGFDAYGNAYFSPKLNYFRTILSAKPSVSASGATSFCEDKSVTLSSNYEFGNTWSNSASSRSVTVNSAGNYSVTHRNVYGCVSTSDATEVRTFPLPQPSVTLTGNQDICSGTSVQLESNIRTGIQWNNGSSSPAITVTSSGNYFVRAVNEYGCEKNSSPIRITVYNTPAQPLAVRAGTYSVESLISGDTTNLFYEWKLENNPLLTTTVNRFKASQTGNYTVNAYKNYTLADNSILKCVSETSPFLYFVLSPEDDGVSFYPNPLVTEDLTVETLEDIDHAYIVIHDLYGRLIYESYVDLLNVPRKIDLSRLPAGQYMVMIKNNRFKLTKRIIKI